MKDIDKKDPSDVSGGSSSDVGSLPPFPIPVDYPPNPIGPFPDPYPGPLPCPTDTMQS